MFDSLRRLFCDEILPAEQMKQQKATVVEKTAVALTVNDKIKFRSDIARLTERYGELVPGKRIVLTLQDALIYLPRDRKRVDAYDTLAKYLAERHITLIVESRKTKKNEKN